MQNESSARAISIDRNYDTIELDQGSRKTQFIDGFKAGNCMFFIGMSLIHLYIYIKPENKYYGWINGWSIICKLCGAVFAAYCLKYITYTERKIETVVVLIGFFILNFILIWELEQIAFTNFRDLVYE